MRAAGVVSQDLLERVQANVERSGKKGRPRSENPMVHTAIVLPRDLLDRLRKDAERSDQGLSTEIRHRLQSSYQTSDRKTTELLTFIGSLADSLERDLGKKWHESSYAVAAFKGGLLTLLAPYEPNKGERDIPGHLDEPEAVGRTHARLIMAQRQDQQKLR
jgi:hypothetical protein